MKIETTKADTAALEGVALDYVAACLFGFAINKIVFVRGSCSDPSKITQVMVDRGRRGQFDFSAHDRWGITGQILEQVRDLVEIHRDEIALPGPGLRIPRTNDLKSDILRAALLAQFGRTIEIPKELLK